MIRRIGGVWMAVVLAIVTGCAGPQAVATRDPAQRLKERAAQYWDARVGGDLLATYMLHEPAFRRAVSLTAFLQGRGVTTIFDYELLGEKIEGDRGIVKTKTKWSVTHPMLVKGVDPKWSEFEEEWVRVDGEWYRKFRFPIGDPYPPINWDDVAAERTPPPSRPGQ